MTKQRRATSEKPTNSAPALADLAELAKAAKTSAERSIAVLEGSSVTSTRFETAVNRNLAELQKVLLIRETLLGIEQLRYTGKVFIRVINDALHNDYMSHSIKVFEQGSQAASFWYIYRSDARQIDLHARRTGYSLRRFKRYRTS